MPDASLSGASLPGASARGASLPAGSPSADVPPASLPATGVNTLLIGVGVVALLYLGREVFVPITLAVLLSFVLAPVVMLLRRVRVGRVPSVVVAVLLAVLIILGIGWQMGRQAAQLAGDLPRYQATILQKVQSVRDMSLGGGILDRASDMLKDVRREIEKPDAAATPPAPAARPGPGQPPRLEAPADKPVLVEVRQPEPDPLTVIRDFAGTLLHPLATAGIVIVFVMFILMQREDLRDRIIRLVGSRDLQRTTVAMDDAAARLSRYFLLQTTLNASFGVLIGVGLWLIGVPSPILWGILAGLSRFVPYIGAIIAALFPAALALAVDPGWSMLGWTLSLFLITEPLMGHVVEPLVYGQSTGVSPIAVIVSATFWTWLWGPVGLLLATPLTVCVVVLGRHVPQLEFLDVMLGDRPALTPEESFYQRVLSGHAGEAADAAEPILKERPLAAYYDEVAIRGLALARADAVRGSLEPQRLEAIREGVLEVVEDLGDHEDTQPEAPLVDGNPVEPDPATKGAKAGSATPMTKLNIGDLAPAWRAERPVLLIPGRDPLDAAAASLLVQLLEKHGIGARLEPADTMRPKNIAALDTSGVALVVLSYLEDGARPVGVRYLTRRLRRKAPDAALMVGVWGSPGTLADREAICEASGADHSATSLRRALEICLRAAKGGVEDAGQEEKPVDPRTVGLVAAE